MTTEAKSDDTSETTAVNKPENKTTDNKIVFAPLGKYALIAVLMVCIIVTAAIMLNKELYSVEQEISVIEEEVAALTIADADKTASENLTTSTEVSASHTQEKTTTSASLASSTELSIKNTQKDTATSSSETKVMSAPSAEVAVATETATETMLTDDSVTPLASTETATAANTMQDRQAQLTRDNQARIETHKLEQKQHMTDMFARIKTLETQQLDQYKTRQDAQVERLREQIAKQQQMIDSLISRNTELYKLRAATVQKNQTNREQMLNRI